MAVSNTQTLVQYVGNASSVTAYTIPFPFLDEAWIKVQLMAADGTVTNLTLGADYTVTGAGNPTSGSLTTTVAYAATYQLTIYRQVPLTQLLDLVYNDRLPAASIEQSLDKLTYLTQQLAIAAGSNQKSLTFPLSEPAANDTELPVPALRLGKFLYFNDLTGEMELVSVTGDGNVVTGDGTTIDILASVVGVINNGITNAKLAQVATATIKGRRTAGAGNVEDIALTTFLSDLVAAGAAQQPLVVTGSVTATLGRTHHVTASATFTDPTGVEGAGYIVKVLNGPATVGATAYSSYGTIIERTYLSGAWQTNRYYLNKAQLDTTYATFAQGALAASATQLTYGTPVATTSGTSVDITGIPSTVKKITFHLNGVGTNGAGALLLRIGDSGGIESTGYSGSASDDTTRSAATTAFVLTVTGAAAYLFSGSITLTRFTASSNTWVASGVVASDAGFVTMTAGLKELSATLDRVRLTSVGPNTFDAGEINITYE